MITGICKGINRKNYMHKIRKIEIFVHISNCNTLSVLYYLLNLFNVKIPMFKIFIEPLG